MTNNCKKDKELSNLTEIPQVNSDYDTVNLSTESVEDEQLLNYVMTLLACRQLF